VPPRSPDYNDGKPFSNMETLRVVNKYKNCGYVQGKDRNISEGRIT